MSWNYRIIRRKKGNAVCLEIHEVYYNLDGSIKGWTENSIIPSGETIEELKQDFSKQLLAFESPILDHEALAAVLREKK